MSQVSVSCVLFIQTPRFDLQFSRVPSTLFAAICAGGRQPPPRSTSHARLTPPSESVLGKKSPRLRLPFGGSSRAADCPSPSALRISRSEPNLSNLLIASVVFRFWAARPPAKGRRCSLHNCTWYIRCHRGLSLCPRSVQLVQPSF